MNSKNIQFLHFFIAGLIIIFLLSFLSCTESGILYDNNGNNENNVTQTDNVKKAVREQNELLISEPVFKSDSKFICVLQDVDYKMLTSTDFDIAIVDPDDSKLTKKNILGLHSQDKALIAYLSIGEAENYRNYWQKEW